MMAAGASCWWLFCLLWSVLLAAAACILWAMDVPAGPVMKKGQRNKATDDGRGASASNRDVATNDVTSGTAVPVADDRAPSVVADDHHDDNNDDDDGVSTSDSAPLTLVDLPPEVHCHIVSLLDARGAVAYVGAARALRFLDHRQALALRPTAAIGECVCGCEMHMCDRCSCGGRADMIDSTVRMGCSTLCYPAHIASLMAAERFDEARALCHRLEGLLLLPAFAHLGEARSRRALTSWLLCDSLWLRSTSASTDAAIAALAHEMAGTCVFREEIWECSSPIGIESALARGHYACAKASLTTDEINKARGGFGDPLSCVAIENILDEAASAGDDPRALERLAAMCRAAQHFNAKGLADGATVRRLIQMHNRTQCATITPRAIAVIAQYAPGVGEIAAPKERARPAAVQWCGGEALLAAFIGGRFDEADRLCAEAREALGDGDGEYAEMVAARLDATASDRLHRHVVYADDPEVATGVANILSRHFPRAWSAQLRAALFGKCLSSQDCTPCTAVMHVRHLSYTTSPSLGGLHVCFALWPSPHRRGRRVAHSRERALALLRHPSVRWPRRAALTAAAYGDIEVLDALTPNRVDNEPQVPGSLPWNIGVVALLAAAGYEQHARHMGRRYGIAYAAVDVAGTVAALDITKARKPWSRLYSNVLPRCPLPLTAQLSLCRKDARRTIQEAMDHGVGVPLNAVDAVHLAAAFPGIFDDRLASRVIKPTTAVGAVDWLYGQTALMFDSAYVVSCASIGATGVVHLLMVRNGITCDVDAVRVVLPDWVGSYFEPDSDYGDEDGAGYEDGDGDDGTRDNNNDDGGSSAGPVGPMPWIDFMEPVLRAAINPSAESAPTSDNNDMDPCGRQDPTP
ncbi:hypothetical protein psal_cds_691 [Pandoravirus salinus]|uniref:Uncharacterized protein n=1 Tax=Pandoravirus salinus TaxID=1349410 RepID=A0A291ATN2_9VIRU|nr:hypothetical protein psal_cds_691 [Pandoravirus salinus]ATE82214.1 hypothetical protein psal_cds_691 [Pandoravirus salinus]